MEPDIKFRKTALIPASNSVKEVAYFIARYIRYNVFIVLDTGEGVCDAPN